MMTSTPIKEQRQNSDKDDLIKITTNSVITTPEINVASRFSLDSSMYRTPSSSTSNDEGDENGNDRLSDGHLYRRYEDEIENERDQNRSSSPKTLATLLSPYFVQDETSIGDKRKRKRQQPNDLPTHYEGIPIDIILEKLSISDKSRNDKVLEDGHDTFLEKQSSSDFSSGTTRRISGSKKVGEVRRLKVKESVYLSSGTCQSISFDNDIDGESDEEEEEDDDNDDDDDESEEDDIEICIARPSHLRSSR